MTNFVPFNRDQAFLLLPDLKSWLPDDDVAHFVVAAVERVPIGAFQVAQRPVVASRRLDNDGGWLSSPSEQMVDYRIACDRTTLTGLGRVFVVLPRLFPPIPTTWFG